MESQTTQRRATSSTNPLLSVSTFLHRLSSELTTRLDDGRRLAGYFTSKLSHVGPLSMSLPFSSISQSNQEKHVAVGPDHVAKTLAGTSVYTVSNTNNEFVLISDPNSGTKSIALLCFRKEDAEAFLAQVQSRRKELRSQAKIVPISLDQVYMLKVEGIAFRFLPDPVQIKNAIELKSSESKTAFDGIPVFQSDLLVVKRKNKRYCPIYFRKEDIEKELSLRTSRGRGSQQVVVGSLEDVLKKMEISEKNSGWDDFIFIPPGKSHLQHIQEVVKA